MIHTIQTPRGPRIIPEDAKCECVAKHLPMVLYPYPFVMPDGSELWLCPTTLNHVTTLIGMYKQFWGPPDSESVKKFTFYTRRLVSRYWELYQLREEYNEDYRAWKAEQKAKDEDLYAQWKRAQEALSDV